MNEQTLSMRLERVAAHVPQGARLADIGSDHGYLPVALVLRGLVSAAVAGEVAMTPYRAALRSVQENDLHALIRVRLADGLAAIKPGDGITAISFCGMGGETIRDLLAAGQSRLNGRERLILQPNGGEQPLRQWLMEHGYRIVAEEVLHENRFYYEIIVAEPSGPVSYSPQALYFGPLQLQARSAAFVAKWARLLKLKRRTLTQLSAARQDGIEDRVNDLEQEIEKISAMLGADSNAHTLNGTANHEPS